MLVLSFTHSRSAFHDALITTDKNKTTKKATPRRSNLRSPEESRYNRREESLESLFEKSVQVEDLKMVAMPNHTYVWEEGVPEEEVEDGTNVRLVRVSTDVLLPGPTMENQVKVKVLDDFKTLEVSVQLPKTFVTARRTAVRAAHATGINPANLGGVINQALSMARVSSHQQQVNKLYPTEDKAKCIFQVDLPMEVDKHFTRRNDYGQDGAAQGLSIATYRHEHQAMRNANQFVYILHIEMTAREKPTVRVSSPQGFNIFHDYA